MLKDMSAGVNRLLTGLRPRPGAKRVNLALQGGGAHGAFTWGVLDYLLEDGRLTFSAVSGASAGAGEESFMDLSLPGRTTAAQSTVRRPAASGAYAGDRHLGRR